MCKLNPNEIFYTFTRFAKYKQKKRTENIECDYLERLEFSYMVGRQNGNLAISHKLITPLPCDPTFPLLDVYP